MREKEEEVDKWTAIFYLNNWSPRVVFGPC